MKRFLAVASLALAGAALAQTYPDKPVKIIVGFPAGGPTDIVARLFAERANASLHQPFVVENKPGANSVLAAEAVASSKPDGYTLLAAATSHALIPALYSDRVKFDASKSFAPICIVAKSPNVLVVGPQFGVKTLPEFLRKVRESPGKYTYASVGVGSGVHLATENFLSMTKTSMTHIPYKGAAPASLALVAGEVDAYFASAGSVLAQIKAGKLIAIAVASRQRSPQLPGVPTFAEAGVPGFEAEIWYALLAPAGTSEPVVRALEREAEGFTKDAGVRGKLFDAGIETETTCGAAFAKQLDAEIATYARVAKTLNLKIE